jgi:beta-N-acetylhexosaminidase
MEALSDSIPERAGRSLAAGCDIALNCWAKMDDMRGIAKRLPVMPEQTAARLERALAGTRLDGASGEQAALLARRDALLALLPDRAEARA